MSRRAERKGDSFYEEFQVQGLMKRIFAGQATDEERARADELRSGAGQRIFETPLEELFIVSKPTSPAPRQAKILDSLPCSACGESAMESRTRRFGGQTYCIPCFEQVEQKR
jgi:formylmethanofuran dehydrogenase subunit E